MTPLHFQIKKGLDLPITGEPEQKVDGVLAPETVAVLGRDYVGMKPTMQVKAGDRVKLGQTLFLDKKSRVPFTSPGCGEVVAVHRGAKRRFLSVVVRLDGDDAEHHALSNGTTVDRASREEIRDLLLASGLWTSLRARPFSHVADPASEPGAIFVNAADTNPLGADPAVVLDGAAADFSLGLQALTKLTSGSLYLTTRPGKAAPGADLPGVTHATFAGPHPAGLVGTHIHMLAPVSAHRSVWHANYQDTIAIGRLLRTGTVDPNRVIALGGPAMVRPRLVQMRLGARLDTAMHDEVDGLEVDGRRDVRIISGSVLSGDAVPADGAEVTVYLGRYHLQVSALREGRKRVFLGWHRPGADMYSVQNVFVSALHRAKKRFPFTTAINGSRRAMVPIGSFEKVMPLDILPTFLLRALLSGDTDQAQKLGALELDEEDLGLCTFVCPGKTEYGPLLRANLTLIEEEG